MQQRQNKYLRTVVVTQRFLLGHFPLHNWEFFCLDINFLLPLESPVVGHWGFLLSISSSMDNEQNNDFPERNRIFRMAKERIAEQNAAREADRKANLGKRGPKTGHTVEVIKLAKVVGRNKVPVVPEDVEHMAQLGCTDNEIAKYLGITDHSLRRNFEDELINGRHRLRTSLRQAQIRFALEGQPTLLIWLGKNLLSQNEMGQANDENRPLPWSDTLDDDVVDEDDDETTIQTQDDEDTAFE